MSVVPSTFSASVGPKTCTRPKALLAIAVSYTIPMTSTLLPDVVVVQANLSAVVLDVLSQTTVSPLASAPPDLFWTSHSSTGPALAPLSPPRRKSIRRTTTIFSLMDYFVLPFPFFLAIVGGTDSTAGG